MLGMTHEHRTPRSNSGQKNTKCCTRRTVSGTAKFSLTAAVTLLERAYGQTWNNMQTNQQQRHMKVSYVKAQAVFYSQRMHCIDDCQSFDIQIQCVFCPICSDVFEYTRVYGLCGACTPASGTP